VFSHYKLCVILRQLLHVILESVSGKSAMRQSTRVANGLSQFHFLEFALSIVTSNQQVIPPNKWL